MVWFDSYANSGDDNGDDKDDHVLNEDHVRASENKDKADRRDLMGAHLISMHLTGVYFIGVDLTGVYLIGVYLTDVHLMGMHLIGMHLIGMYIMGRVSQCGFWWSLVLHFSF
jgi:hypothetical protein